MAYHRTQNLGIDVDRLSVPGSVPPGVPEFRSHPSALKGGSSETKMSRPPSSRRGVSCLDQKIEILVG